MGRCRVGARAFLCVPSCAGVHCDSVGAASEHCWYTGDAAVKTDVEKGVK